MARYSPRSELEALQALNAELLQMLSGEPARLARRAASVSGWSALEHAAHLTLANELVLRNLRSLARGSGMLVVHEAAQDDEALALLASGSLPRGRASAPRMVVPPAGIDLPTARSWAEGFGRDLADFARGFEPGSGPRCWIPHQILGPLDLCEWARFGAVHSAHHLAIAREALAARD